MNFLNSISKQAHEGKKEPNRSFMMSTESNNNTTSIPKQIRAYNINYFVY